MTTVIKEESQAYNDNDNQDTRNNGVGIMPENSHQVQASVSDGGRDARIAQRKARIEAARIIKFRPNDNEDQTTRRTKKVEVESRDTSKAKTQIALAQKRIDSVKESGNETVTNIRAAVTARESIRRADESKKIQIWENKELQEQLDSRKAQEEIDAEWSKVEQLSGPYQLHELLEKQKKSCGRLLGIKGDLIEEYVSELKIKDDEYVRELKRQTEEIDKLLERMEGQYKTYKTALVAEADQIEKAFVEERTELLNANGNESDKLFDTRRSNEAKYMNERADRIEDYIKQLEQLRVSDSEEYNLVKIKLETDVQVLEQQLQQMRVTYLLNQEKLEYNYQVLKKREEENGTILGAQKRKINRLADHLNMLKIKSARQEKTFQQENASFNDDFKHLTEQYKELQKKFRHFQLADSKRFKEIWKMNEEEAKEIMRKVLQADRIINEQQLGLKWEPPKEDLFRNIDPLSFRGTTGSSIPKNLREAEADYEQEMNNRATNPNGDAIDLKESLTAQFQDLKAHSKTMKKTLELLCNEAGFLVEDKLQKLLSPLHKDEQSLMRLDSIFKALGVDTIEDIERLTSFFVDGASGQSSQENQAERAQLIYEDSAILIHPNDVVTAIRKFVETQNGVRSADHNTGAPQLLSATSDNGDDDLDILSNDGNNTTNLQKDYWNRMANVINEKSYRTWTAVYKGMEHYHTLLTQRFQTSQKISLIEKQNGELKALLRQYMNARVNDELQVPPTHIMLAQAGLQ